MCFSKNSEFGIKLYRDLMQLVMENTELMIRLDAKFTCDEFRAFDRNVPGTALSRALICSQKTYQ